MSNDPEMLEPIEEELPTAPSAEVIEGTEESDLDSASQPVYFESKKDLDPVLDPMATFHEHNIKAPKSPALTIHIASWATPIIGVLMLVVGLAGGFFLRPVLLPTQTAVAPTAVTASNPTAAQAQPTQQQPSANDRDALMEAIAPQVRHFKGNPEAPITLIEFSDFQWPFCARFATDAGRQIQEEYVAAGDVRFGYIHFAFLGPESQWAAEASECAADQDKFWEYHDFLFENHGGENQGAFNKDNLKAFAVELGLESDQFNECMDTEKYAQIVLNQTRWAQNLGVQSTPTMVVNGYPVIGAQGMDVFENLFNSILSP